MKHPTNEEIRKAIKVLESNSYTYEETDFLGYCENCKSIHLLSEQKKKCFLPLKKILKVDNS